MKVWKGFVALVGMLGSGAAMADGNLVIVFEQAAKVAEKLPDSSSFVTVIVSVAAVMISIATFVIGYMQMRIASAKVKLDLYNKRFNVYLAALEFYQDIHSEVRETLKVRAVKFVHAHRESKFLFDERSGVYETLGIIQKNSATVRAYEEFWQSPKSLTNSDFGRKLHNDSLVAHAEMGKDILKLEGQLKDYLSFHNVRGWKFLK